MRVEIIRDKCIGSGSCEMLAPEVVEVGDDGVVYALIEEPPADIENRVRQAVESCPTRSLSLS